jgi:hypothetical protein
LGYLVFLPVVFPVVAVFWVGGFFVVVVFLVDFLVLVGFAVDFLDLFAAVFFDVFFGDPFVVLLSGPFARFVADFLRFVLFETLLAADFFPSFPFISGVLFRRAPDFAVIVETPFRRGSPSIHHVILSD